MTTLAYEGTMNKATTLAQLHQHRVLDQIIQGSYWTGPKGEGKGRGCAVGCLTHDPDGGHAQFPETWGVPVQIAYLMDQIFESLPEDEAKDWPVRIMSAIKPGTDLSGVFDRWSVWMLRRLISKAPLALPEVEVMAVLFERVVAGDDPSEDEWAWAAEAAWAAREAREAWAAWAAWSAWAGRGEVGAQAAEAGRAACAAEAAWKAEAAWEGVEAWEAWAAEAAWAAADELVRLVEAA